MNGQETTHTQWMKKIQNIANYQANMMLTTPLLKYVGRHNKWELEGRLSKYHNDYSAGNLTMNINFR